MPSQCHLECPSWLICATNRRAKCVIGPQQGLGQFTWYINRSNPSPSFETSMRVHPHQHCPILGQFSALDVSILVWVVDLYFCRLVLILPARRALRTFLLSARSRSTRSCSASCRTVAYFAYSFDQHRGKTKKCLCPVHLSKFLPRPAWRVGPLLLFCCRPPNGDVPPSSTASATKTKAAAARTPPGRFWLQFRFTTRPRPE